MGMVIYTRGFHKKIYINLDPPFFDKFVFLTLSPTSLLVLVFKTWYTSYHQSKTSATFLQPISGSVIPSSRCLNLFEG